MDTDDLSEADKQKVSAYFRDGQKLRRAALSTASAQRKSSAARQIAKGNKRTLHNLWMAKIKSLKLETRLRDVVCVQLEWCKNKKNKTLQWMIKVVQAIILVLKPLAGAIANIMYMIASGFFDLLCGCQGT